MNTLVFKILTRELLIFLFTSEYKNIREKKHDAYLLYYLFYLTGISHDRSRFNLLRHYIQEERRNRTSGRMHRNSISRLATKQSSRTRPSRESSASGNTFPSISRMSISWFFFPLTFFSATSEREALTTRSVFAHRPARCNGHGDTAAPNYRHFSSFAASARLPVRKCRKIHWKKRSSVNTVAGVATWTTCQLRDPWNRRRPRNACHSAVQNS